VIWVSRKRNIFVREAGQPPQISSRNEYRQRTKNVDAQSRT
jgi:hypothetical protein